MSDGLYILTGLSACVFTLFTIVNRNDQMMHGIVDRIVCFVAVLAIMTICYIINWIINDNRNKNL